MNSPSVSTLLRFEAAWRASFKFLESHGFSITSIQDGEVRFESDQVFVDVWRDPYGYDLDLRVGLSAEPNERLSLAEIELVSGLEESPISRPESITEMRAGMESLARTLSHADPGLLGGDRRVFERVGPIRAAYTARFTTLNDPPSSTT